MLVNVAKGVEALYYTNTPPKGKLPCNTKHLKSNIIFTHVKDRRTMMDERMTAKGLGHQVGWIVS